MTRQPTGRIDALARSIARAEPPATRPPDGAGIVVAVSGGPDSTALLHLLDEIARPRGWRLTVAHFDHRLRPESGRDAAAVRRVARRLGWPVVVGRPRAPITGPSVEAAARAARYRFLAETAAATDSGYIATGHNRRDQAESVLLHLIRGCGLDGLAGMADAGPLPVPAGLDLTLWRPLLRVDPDDLLAYCRRRRLRPCLDPTNTDPRFTRNRICLDVLPGLAAINPRVVEAIAHLADLARHDAAELTARAEAATAELAGAGGASPIVDRAALAALSAAIRPRAIRRLGERAGVDINARQIAAIDRIVESGQDGSIDLAPGIAFWCAGDRCGLGPRPALPEPPPAPVGLAWPGNAAWGAWAIEARLAEPVAATRSPYEAIVPIAGLPDCLTVRSRRPGDRIHLAGLDGSTRLQDYFVNQKVPRADRDRIPIVLAGDHVIWIAGHRVDRCFRVEADRGPAVRLRAIRKAG